MDYQQTRQNHRIICGLMLTVRNPVDTIRRVFRDSPLVQSVERRTVNPYVAGSSPAGGATFKAK